MASSITKDIWTYIFIAIIVVMGIEILYLFKQNRELRAIIENPKEHLGMLEEEQTVPPFTSVDIFNDTITVSFGPDQPFTMLFWLSSECSVCKDNLPFWNRLFEERTSEHIRYLGMCADSRQAALEYASEYGILFPVVCPDDPQILDSYKGNILPQTIFISPQGSILKVWPGALAQGKEDQILAILQQLQS